MNYNMQGMTKEIPEVFVMLKSTKVEIKKEHQVLMIDKTTSFNTTKKYTSMMIRVCHSRSRFLSCMYIHEDFIKNQDSHTCAIVEVFHDITKVIITEVYFFVVAPGCCLMRRKSPAAGGRSRVPWKLATKRLRISSQEEIEPGGRFGSQE